MDHNFAEKKEYMIQRDLIRRGISDRSVLAAFRSVTREAFVPDENRPAAYEDHPLDIGYGQTISQPYIVAYMLQELEIQGHERVLEIGMGSGYVTALLRALSAEVYAVERIPLLACRAMHVLASLDMSVNVKIGDGTQGWPDEAPFAKIIVSAASPQINDMLFGQLTEGGIMVSPVGGILGQELLKIRKKPGGVKEVAHLCGCSFVPLIGKHGFRQ